MLQGFRVYDADAHAFMTPAMWDSLPAEYAARRPRPVRISDDSNLGGYNTGWLIEGRIEPHPFGPGAQQANTPRLVLEEFGAPKSKGEFAVSSLDLTDPENRLQDLDRMGIDFQVLFPTTLYAHMTADPGFEAALFRAYNRFMGRQCKAHAKRLKWAGLLPLRDPQQGCEAVEEMVELGACAGVVFGTVGERLLSHPSFTPVWNEFSRTALPLCVHMGMSYTPFEQICESIFDGHIVGMCMPAQLAFAAIVGHGMLDRYPDLRVAFLEFGAEWLFYMVARMDHYLPRDRGGHPWNLSMPVADRLPRKRIEEYTRSGRIFVAAEAEDKLMLREMELLGEDQILYSSDFPHGEGRESSALEILERRDISENQKRKLLYENTVRLYGEP